MFVLSATVHEKIVALNLWDSVHSGRGSTFCIRDLGDRTQFFFFFLNFVRGKKVQFFLWHKS